MTTEAERAEIIEPAASAALDDGDDVVRVPKTSVVIFGSVPVPPRPPLVKELRLLIIVVPNTIESKAGMLSASPNTATL